MYEMIYALWSFSRVIFEFSRMQGRRKQRTATRDSKHISPESRLRDWVSSRRKRFANPSTCCLPRIARSLRTVKFLCFSGLFLTRAADRGRLLRVISTVPHALLTGSPVCAPYARFAIFSRRVNRLFLSHAFISYLCYRLPAR